MNCLTLLSDFGLQDASVAAVKGILMQYVPQVPLVDISHSIEPFHMQQAAYTLATAYRHFPKGTCHLVLFDVLSEEEAQVLFCEKEGHFFIGPDNGVLSLAFNGKPDRVGLLHQVSPEHNFKDWVHHTGQFLRQLHRDGGGKLSLPACELKKAPVNWQPKVEDNRVECHVIHIDRFENVVVNLTRSEFESIGKGRPFRIEFMRDEELNELSVNYNNVREGEKLCRFNSAGFLEIAINRGKAASLFGLRVHREQHLMYNTIKIFFE